MTLTVAYLGNFQPDLPSGATPWSTESHVARSIESLSHQVIRIQEGVTPALEVPQLCKGADVFLHTQTYGLAVTSGTLEEREAARLEIASMGIMSVFFHLDLWHGLERQVQLVTSPEPWAKYDHVFTTDGGSDAAWKELGINHHWMSPGVFHEEAIDGTPRLNYSSDVAFVGSLKYGHPEHEPTRTAMLDALRRKYHRRFRTWPVRQAIRGMELNDLLASVKVWVGDSCLAGQVKNYWSDRVPEVTGRGGFLIHPHVPGILNEHPDLVTFEPGNWDEMIEKVDWYLEHNAAREELRISSAEWTRTHHTYKHKMQHVLDTIGL